MTLILLGLALSCSRKEVGLGFSFLLEVLLVPATLPRPPASSSSSTYEGWWWCTWWKWLLRGWSGGSSEFPCNSQRLLWSWYRWQLHNSCGHLHASNGTAVSSKCRWQGWWFWWSTGSRGKWLCRLLLVAASCWTEWWWWRWWCLCGGFRGGWRRLLCLW